MTIFSAVALVAVVLPFLFWLVQSLTEQEIYHGDAVLLPGSPRLTASGKQAKVDLSVPQIAVLTADVSAWRFDSLKCGIGNVAVSVHKQLFGKPWLNTIQWRPANSAFGDLGDTTAGSTRDFEAWLELYLLVTGCLFFASASAASAVALVLAGFIFGAALRRLIKLDGGPLITTLVVIGWFGCGSFTWLLFQQVGWLTLVFGLPFAFVFGLISELLVRKYLNEKL